LVPRPKDLMKSLIVPLPFAVGALAAGGTSREQVLRALLVWAVLELLVYPARYQWNGPAWADSSIIAVEAWDGRCDMSIASSAQCWRPLAALWSAGPRGRW
jgi:hypothetical protein